MNGYYLGQEVTNLELGFPGVDDGWVWGSLNGKRWKFWRDQVKTEPWGSEGV